MDAQANMEAAPAIFSEDELKRMSRQVKELIPYNEVGPDDRIRIRSLSDKLFVTATSPSLLATHRVAAWNALCAFIDEIARSDVQPIQDLLWEHGIWLTAWHLYIDESQYARPKSGKQLLVTLGNALRKGDGLAGVQDYVVKRTSDYLENDSRPRQTKAFLQLLTHFCSKDLLDLKSINGGLLADVKARKGTKEDSSIADLLSCLFRWASHEDFGSVTGRCISVVLDKYSETKRRHTTETSRKTVNLDLPVWSSALDGVLRHSDTDIHQLRIHVFPILFKRGLPQYVSFLHTHGLERLVRKRAGDSSEEHTQHNEHRLLYAALQSGKELGLIVESDGADVQADDAVLHVPIKAFGVLLSSPDRKTRITGLSTLVHSHSATRPFLPRALNLFKANISTFFADTDANFRSEVFSLVQRLVDRLRAITAVLARVTAAPTSNAIADEGRSVHLQQHRGFLHWLLRFLTWELRPTASYQRHISALKSLSIIAQSGIDHDVPSAHWFKSASGETKWPFNFSILHAGLEQLLIDLLVDPFDDVRQTAASILSLYARPLSAIGVSARLGSLNATIERAEKTMLTSGRADQADGVAHMYSLLAQTSSTNPDQNGETQSRPLNVLTRLISDLEQMLEGAQTSLSTAAKRYPMHGLLTSIRFTLAQQVSWPSKDELRRLVDCLRRVWETVKPVLCNDAPEGYEHEDVGDLTGESSKDVLSYCWRALKDSSLLLGASVTDQALDGQVVTILGNLCFSQLAELRHRGAFSTVAQTWVLCCGRGAALTPAQGSEPLLVQWYRQAFDILRNKTTINTRRPAGIPSLLCGLLIADKTASMLSAAFQDLTAIAQEPVDAALANESSLPQVHALNCIKDILKNTRLGEQSDRYVPSSLHLAATSLRSEAWAIRNCGLMLFRGVIDRLLGTSDAYLEDDASGQKRIAVQQHPGLLDTVLELLEIPEASDGSDANQRYEGVFPALQMLQRMDIPPIQRQQAQDAVLMLTASPSWHVREKAARTYAALMSSAEPTTSLVGVLQARVGDENAVHGAILCLKHMASIATTLIRRSPRQAASTAPVSEKLLSTILRALDVTWFSQFDYAHPVTKSAWIDALVQYMRLGDAASRHPEVEDVFNKHDPSLLLDFLARLSSMLRVRTDDWAIEAMERTSLARALAHQWALGYKFDTSSPSKWFELHLETMLALSRMDADACVEFWRTLRTEVEAGAHIPPGPLSTCLLPLVSSIMSGGLPVQLKCEVQKFLLSLVDGGFASKKLVQACSQSSSPLAADSNQTYADQWLQLYAITLDSRLKRSELSVEDFSSFVSTCKAAVADSGSAFFSREAAALALSRMQHLWSFIAQRKGALACDTYLIIYDLLNDDDEDIRLLAAQTVSHILRSANSRAGAKDTHYDPITASQRLQSHMLALLSHDRAFAVEAFARAFGNLNDTVVDQLHAFSQPDTALFATEKQNLYVDPGREVRAWSQVSLRLQPSSIPKTLVKDLTFWVDEGLYTLTSRLGKGGDAGAMGWTSRAEVFALGLKVVHGVEVLMGYVRTGGRLPMEGSEVVRRLALFGLALEPKAAGADVLLWRWEVQRVLGGIVEGRVQLAWALAAEVEDAGRANGGPAALGV